MASSDSRGEAAPCNVVQLLKMEIPSVKKQFEGSNTFWCQLRKDMLNQKAPMNIDDEVDHSLIMEAMDGALGIESSPHKVEYKVRATVKRMNIV
jgi:hypothetical protein